MAEQDKVMFEILRYRPDEEAEPAMQRYDVPFHEDWVVLDALNYIKDELDGTLSFRWSCQMGVCGSCGMMINGDPKLSCSEFLRDYLPRPIRVEPLVNFPVIRDLVINLDDFFEKLAAVEGWLIPRETRPEEQPTYQQTPAERARYEQFSMCINCMLCYAACPVYGQDPDFIGPAALALAQRYNLDSRDAGKEARAATAFGGTGVWQCTFVGDCTRVCPANVDPAGAIQQGKLTAAIDWWRSVMVPWGTRRPKGDE